jgi:hypothetical protein
MDVFLEAYRDVFTAARGRPFANEALRARDHSTFVNN